MRLRLVLPLLIAAALAFAYAAPSLSHSFEPAPRRALRGDTITTSLDVTLADEVRFSLHVTNGSAKRVELRFPSGQTHEIVVLDPRGREVWRWSRGRLFTQAIQNRNLGASDTLTFTESWRPTHAGSYTAVASLLSENFPTQERVEFSLPAKAITRR